MTVRTELTTHINASTVEDDKVTSEGDALGESSNLSMHGINDGQPEYAAVVGGVSPFSSLGKMVGTTGLSSSSADSFFHWFLRLSLHVQNIRKSALYSQSAQAQLIRQAVQCQLLHLFSLHWFFRLLLHV